MAAERTTILGSESDTDPFDSLLDLENQYYSEGYNLGVSDGTRAGRHEGRAFGMEKGFEKAIEMGRMSGNVAIWKSRLKQTGLEESATHETKTSQMRDAGKVKINPLSGSRRVGKHVARLADLTEPESIPTKNSEEEVQEFEDRLRDATSKAILIAKVVGEHGHQIYGTSDTSLNAQDQDSRSLRVRKAAETGEMEDFAGLRKK